MPQKHLIEVLHVQSCIVTVFNGSQALARIPREYGLGQQVDPPIRQAQQFFNIVVLDIRPDKGDRLVKDTLGVPHTAVTCRSNPGQAPFRDLNLLRLGNLFQIFCDGTNGNPPKVVPLTARQDRRRIYAFPW